MTTTRNPWDWSWYVKWLASACVLAAVLARSAGVDYHQIDVWFSFMGSVGWLAVGVYWEDRAVILLNVVSMLLLVPGMLSVHGKTG